MTARRRADPVKTRAAVAAVAEWLHDDSRPHPGRAALGDAVRSTARTLATLVPGAAVEVRIAPFVAVQCIPGPKHTRGNPPNVVQTDPRTWLLVATGLRSFADAVADGAVQVSGARAAEVGRTFPLVVLPDPA
ncbi:MAG: hypothetical protein K0U84_11280 [Actinomycetia bacterium]|nr:hypothetical protein [Actinomycetes bacterium]